MARKITHRNALLVRLLALLRELDRRDGCDIDELAARHQVATRTIRRDLDALQEAGVPLVAEDDGRRKRWRIASADSRRQLANVIDTSHYVAVRAAMGGAANRGSITFDTLEDLARKLERVLSAKERGRLAALAECFVPDERRALKLAGPDVLWPLMTAIADMRCCRIDYVPPGCKARSIIGLPLNMFSQAGTTYVLVHHREEDVVITLALHRMRALEVTDETAKPPARFDASTYVTSLFEVHGSADPVRYRLCFAPAVAAYIRERQWHPTQRLRNRRDGAVVLEFTCKESFQVTAWIASWRHHVTVLAPSAVRAELRKLGGELAARYALPACPQRSSCDQRTGADGIV